MGHRPKAQDRRPSQAGGESGSQNIAGRREGNVGGIFRQGRTERLTEAAKQLLVANLRGVDLGGVEFGAARRAMAQVIATAYRKAVQGWDQQGYLKHKEAWFWSHPLWFKDGKA